MVEAVAARASPHLALAVNVLVELCSGTSLPGSPHPDSVAVAVTVLLVLVEVF